MRESIQRNLAEQVAPASGADGGTLVRPIPRDPVPGRRTPATIMGFVWRISAWDQLWLALLSIMVFVLNTAPLELQRRIVNDAIGKGSLRTILLLALAYAAMALAENGFKLLLNVYRGWVSENAVRRLRKTVYVLANGLPAEYRAEEIQGVELSILLSEVEPVGGFVGSSISEPLLQGGILLSVFGYMLYLEPWMALLSLAMFSPQFVIVPMMQNAINRRAKARIQTLREVSTTVLGELEGAGESASSQDARIDHVLRLNMGIFKLKFTMNMLMNLVHHFGIAMVLGVGGWYAVDGVIGVGTVVAFISGLEKINDPWGDVVNWYRDLAISNVKYRLVADMIDRLRGYGEASAASPALRWLT